MRFIIVGAGAIGGTLGGRLALAGAEVVLVARGAQLAALRAGGLRLEAPDGAVTVAVPVVDTPGAVAWRPGDVVLLAVKSQDAAAALSALAAVAPPTTPVACLTNGLEVERLALRWFADVHGVCVFLPASVGDAGVVQQWLVPVRGALEVGRYPDGATAVDDELAAWFARAGCSAVVRTDVMRWKRGKLVSNVGNAVEALCGGAADDSELMRRAEAEAHACFAAAGLSVPSEAETAARWAGLVLGQIAGREREGGSTWQSLARGVGSAEGDYLNGEVALLGRMVGVATPVNALLQRRIAAAARGGARPGSVRSEALAAELAG